MLFYVGEPKLLILELFSPCSFSYSSKNLSGRVTGSLPVLNIKAILTTYNSGEKSTKYYIKGARLILYPKGLRIFRHSYGIKLPITQRMTNREAMESLVNHKLTYEKTIEINCKNKLDDNLSENNVINYRYFNKS